MIGKYLQYLVVIRLAARSSDFAASYNLGHVNVLGLFPTGLDAPRFAC